jgi:hypothetical protein
MKLKIRSLLALTTVAAVGFAVPALAAPNRLSLDLGVAELFAWTLTAIAFAGFGGMLRMRRAGTKSAHVSSESQPSGHARRAPSGLRSLPRTLTAPTRAGNDRR